VVFYLAVYLLMNIAAFAVIVARERETGLGDDISTLYGLGAERPLLAWPMTIAMLSLGGFPVTAGFFGKVYLIGASVENGYTWLGVAIVIGSAVSLAYYLRVVAAVWMRGPAERTAVAAGAARPAIAGGSAEADTDPEAVAASARVSGRRLIQPEVVGLGVLCAAASVFFGVYPSPLLDLAEDAGAALTNLF
jgi:NADH-quinone oxidoreductase subunit N